jgi:hypothetical protein
MADLKISAATLNPAPAGTDNFATDKAGADFRTTLDQIKAFAVVGAADVFKVGTPAVDQIGVWTGDGTIKGFPGFKFDGSQLLLPNYSFPAADGAADQVLSTDGAGVLSFKDQNRSGGMLSAPYKFSDSIIAADPGLGLLRFNSATPASVTEIYIDDFDENGIDVSNLLSLITTDDRIYVQTDKDSSEFLVLNVTAPITDNTGWFTIEGTIEASGGLPADGEDLFVILQIGGAASGGGDVFKVGTPANNQIGVWTGDGTIEGDPNFDIISGVLQGVTATGPAIVDIAAGTGVLFAPNKTDLDTGIGWDTDDALSLFAGGIQGFKVAEVGSVITCVFSGNLESTAGFGTGPAIINTGASGTVPTLVPDKTDLDTGVGQSDADQLSLIAGAKEIARCQEVVGAEQFIVSPGFVENNPAFPALAFGNGDTGFFESTDNLLRVSVGGLAKWQFNGDTFRSDTGLGASLQNESASATNPTLVPRSDDQDSGIGANAADQVSLIAGGVEGLRVTEAAAVITIDTKGPILAPDGSAAAPSYSFSATGQQDVGFYRSTTDAVSLALGGVAQPTWEFTLGGISGIGTDRPSMRNVGGGPTTPSLTPRNDDSNTGIGRDDPDQLSLIAGGVEIARAIEAGTSATDQFFLPRDGAAATPSLAIGALGTGFWTGGVAQLNVSIAGSRKAFLNSSAFTVDGSIGVEAATGPRMLLEAPSAVNPVINVRQNDADTGLGSNAVGSMSQISDGEESTRTVAASAGGLQANNQDTGGGLERVLTESDLSAPSVANDAVQARRTTSFTILASFGDVTLDATDIETDAAVIEHVDLSTDDIEVMETGTYKIEYELDIDNALVSGSDLILVEARVRLNDAGTGINGSLASTSAFRDTSVGTGNDNRFFSHLSNGFIANLTANDFVTLQLNQIPDTGGLEVFTAENVSLQVTRLL